MRETKTLALQELKIVGADGDAGSFDGYASMFGTVDSYGDTIDPGAYADTIPQFLERGFIGWGHDWNEPIGIVTGAREDTRGLLINGQFHSDPDAQKFRLRAKERVSAGKFMGLSIGYEALNWEMRQVDQPYRGPYGELTDKVRALTKIRLFEVSLVTVPAEQNSGITGIKDTLTEKRAIGSHSTSTSDGAWDGPANEARLSTDAGASAFRKAFAWMDPDKDPDTKAAYKFIHHEVSSDGSVGAANMRACITGIAVLNGGRGGSTIPDADKQGVYNHLAKHLRDGDRESPPLKAHALRLRDESWWALAGLQGWTDRLESVAGLRDSEGKAGARISAATAEDIQSALDALDALSPIRERLLALLETRKASSARSLYWEFQRLQTNIRST